MAQFFTSPNDVARWVRGSAKNPKDAALLITAILQDDSNHEDVFESTRMIFAGENAEHAATTLFNIFARYKIVEQEIKTAQEKVQSMKTANTKTVAEKAPQIVKEAQITRQPGEYPMPLRVCPKLPMSVGGRLISTYNCRHYCLDSIVLDDDPERIYCAEALWRKHVMDKFSREWMEPKTGQYVGGYINNRFHVFPDAGTPDNPDVARDHGNKMSLAPNERSRQARPHEYSTERRLQEAREKGSSDDSLTRTAGEDLRNALYAQADSKGFVKIASTDVKNPPNSRITDAFNDAIDLHLQGVAQDDALAMIADTYSLKIETAYQVQSMALRKMASHGTDVYMVKTAAPAVIQTDMKERPVGSYFRVNMPIPNYPNISRDQALQKTGRDPVTQMDVFKVVNLADPEGSQNVPPVQLASNSENNGIIGFWDPASADHPSQMMVQQPVIDNALDAAHAEGNQPNSPQGASQEESASGISGVSGKNF